MSSTPTPPRPPMATPAARERLPSRVAVAAAFIIGLSVFLSFRWWDTPPGFRDDAPNIILGGGFIVVLIVVVALLTRLVRGGRISASPLRFCPSCGRQIPFDARFCSYCGRSFG